MNTPPPGKFYIRHGVRVARAKRRECPYCRGKAVVRLGITARGERCYEQLSWCSSCAAKWRELFTLTSVSTIDEGKR